MYKRQDQLLVGIGHRDIGEGGVILRGTHEVHREEPGPALDVREVLIHEAAGDLPGAVGAEVEENNRVVVPDLGVFGAYHGDHKLVGHPGVIGLLHSPGGCLLYTSFLPDLGWT